MNILSDKDASIKLMQAKLDTEKVHTAALCYVNVLTRLPKSKVVKGTPQILLIIPSQEDLTPEVIERKLKANLKPRDLKVGILRMTRTAKGVALTTKDKEDNELIETTIKENSKLKEITLNVSGK